MTWPTLPKDALMGWPTRYLQLLVKSLLSQIWSPSGPEMCMYNYVCVVCECVHLLIQVVCYQNMA